MHTKGSWQVSGVRAKVRMVNAESDAHVIGPDGDPVALALYTDRTNDLHCEMLANARLISAAPDMYEALKGIEHFADAILFREDTLSKALAEWIRAGRQALAKADGRRWDPLS